MPTRSCSTVRDRPFPSPIIPARKCATAHWLKRGRTMRSAWAAAVRRRSWRGLRLRGNGRLVRRPLPSGRCGAAREPRRIRGRASVDGAPRPRLIPDADDGDPYPTSWPGVSGPPGGAMPLAVARTRRAVAGGHDVELYQTAETDNLPQQRRLRRRQQRSLRPRFRNLLAGSGPWSRAPAAPRRPRPVAADWSAGSPAPVCAAPVSAVFRAPASSTSARRGTSPNGAAARTHPDHLQELALVR